MKKLLCLLLALVMVFSLAACGGDKDKPDGDDLPVVENDNTRPEQPDNDDDVVVEPSDDEEEEDDTANVIKTDKFTIPETDAEAEGTIEIAARTPDKFAMNYVQAIANNFYTSAVDAFHVDGAPFMDANDIKFSAPRGELKNLINHAGKEVFLEVNTDATVSNDGSATVYVDLKTDDKTLETFEVKLAMNADNGWYVIDDTYYIKDFYISVPGNTQLYVGDILVSDEYFVKDTGHGSLKDLYKLPVVGRSNKVYKCVCDTFEGTVEYAATANSEEEPFAVAYDLNETELNEALEAAKNIWNNMYKDWAADNNADLSKYFSKTSSPDYPQNCKDGFVAISKASSFKDVDHHITIIEKRDNEDCFYITDSVIVLNIQYQLDYVWDFNGSAEHCRRYSHILLTKEDGEYKIFEITDTELFSSDWGQDW
ncbi:MAG: hypothetical protein IJ419_11345 [Agathobacter sp.]|nr:hypothetical protein [Agathobacter sp.]